MPESIATAGDRASSALVPTPARRRFRLGAATPDPGLGTAATRFAQRFATVVLGLALLGGCGGQPTFRSSTAVIAREHRLRFAIIGDYGCGDLSNYACRPGGEQAAARALEDLQPDDVISLGDDNYGALTLETFDEVIGRYFGRFITGSRDWMHGPNRPNHFWPAPGNHDWYAFHDRSDEIYRQYFAEALGTTDHHYDVDLGPVHLFSIDSGYLDPNGTPEETRFDRELRDVHGAQAAWLKQALASSQSCFNVVLFHHPPYSSGMYATPAMRWPFGAWGADVVLNGHEHFYERLAGADGVTYITNGLGGSDLFKSPTPNPSIGSQLTYGASDSDVAADGRHGAVLMVADAAAGTLHFELHNANGEVIDPFTIHRDCGPAAARPQP